jgi:putative ABC transport system permease protein
VDILVTSLRIALKALGRNKLRTLLTMLGMIIGVGAVITMVALGNAAQRTVEQDVRSAGTNLVHVTAGNYTRGGESMNIASGLGAATTLSAADADAIGRGIRGIKYSSPGVSLRAWTVSPSQRFYTKVQGAGAPFAKMYAWTFARGRFFSDEDVASRARVAVLGLTARDRLFGEGQNAIGREIRIRDQPFAVVGVTNSSDQDQIEQVFVPYTTLQEILGVGYLHTITVAAEEAGDASRLAQEITLLLRRRHTGTSGATKPQSGLTGNMMPQGGGIPDDFTVRTQAAQALTKGLYTSVAAFILANLPKLDEVNMEEMTSTLHRASQTMTALLAGIAAISLLVGGIGIMNIMLVSVTERTREIGIRRAVGARKGDVLLQFLVEAVSLSLIGGGIGIVFGFVVSGAVTRLLEWPTQISANAVLLAFGIAAAVGVFFGFYPARRASQLEPIDALRFE